MLEMDEIMETIRARDRQTYWNQFEPNKHHFFKIMKYSRDHLRIPRKFAMRFPMKLEGTIMLNGPTGDTWPVKVVQTDEDLLVEEGWSQFVTDHDLYAGDFLVFHYAGDNSFDVTVFDRTGCEKDVGLSLNKCLKKPHFFKVMNMDFKSKLIIPRRLVTVFQSKLARTARLKGPSGNVWQVKVVVTEDDVFLEKGWPEFVEDHELKDNEFLVFTYAGDSLFKVLVFDGTGCEKESSHFLKPKIKPARVRARKEKGKGRSSRGLMDEQDNESEESGFASKKQQEKQKGGRGSQANGLKKSKTTNEADPLLRFMLPKEFSSQEIEALRLSSTSNDQHQSKSSKGKEKITGENGSEAKRLRKATENQN